MNEPFQPYLPAILAALSWAPSWLQDVGGGLYVLIVTLGPAAAIVACFMWLIHRDAERTIRQMRQATDVTRREMRQATDATLECWRQEDRLREIKDQLRLDSLPEERRADILDRRQREAEWDRVAQELLRREEAAARPSRAAQEQTATD